MQFENVNPSEIIFKDELFSSEFSLIYRVIIRDRICVMKVHHGRGPPEYYEPTDRELDIHILESTAYRRLKEQGLCDRGIVPQFFGTLDKFDPKQCLPYLEEFVGDECPPSALFLEYIPNLKMIDLENYTKERMDGLIRGIKEIHKASVLHDDPKPRNMMVVEDHPDRVVWLDFNRAETFDIKQPTEKEIGRLNEEEAIVHDLKECLETDILKGELDEAFFFYCAS